jgi:peptidyl-prolyl cis-trans isomerase SurA
MPRRLLVLLLILLLVPSCSLFQKKSSASAKRKADLAAAKASKKVATKETPKPTPAAPAAAVRPVTPTPAAPAPGEEALRPGLAGATYEPQPDIVGTVVAVVNGDIVTRESVLNEIRPQLDAIDRDSSLTAVGRESKRRELISGTVMVKVERLLALQEAKRVIPPEEGERIEADVNSLVKNTIRYVGTLTRLETTLAERGKTVSEQKQTEVDNRMIRALLLREVDANVDVTPAEMQQYYEAHRADYEQKSQVQVREIFLSFPNYPSKDEAVNRGRDLLKRIAAGEDFAKLAREFSDGPNAKTGGLWEFVTEGAGTFRPEVEQVAFSLTPKAVSDVVLSEIGVHILKVEDVRPARTIPFPELQDEIMMKLRGQQREALYRQLIKKLWDRSYVDIHWR